MFLNSLKTDSMERTFRALVRLDLKYGLLSSSFLARHRPAILQVAHSMQLTVTSDVKCSLYFMSRAEAAALNVVLVNIYVHFSL